MLRSLSSTIAKDLTRKPVLLSGPRQCGKTYFGKSLIDGNYDYLNFDVPEDRKRLLKREWYRNRDLVIFDELHKMKKWKSWLKGVFDSDSERQKFLVTGSAKLNTFKKAGDSLAGRYFSYRLYPLDLKEILAHLETTPRDKEIKPLIKENPRYPQALLLQRLLDVSGFPEPFLNPEPGFYRRWQQTHLDVILRQDILETESVRNIKQLETLVLLLTERVGSPLSYNSLREDLSTDDKSIKRWVDILEDAYVIFRVFPYHAKSITSSIRKAPKLYFFDYGRVEDPAARLENLVALSLLKEIHFRHDVHGEIYDLHYIRNKQKKEIDFLVTKNRKPQLMIEVKESDASPSENFSTFEKQLPGVAKLQLVKNLKDERLSKSGIHIVPMHSWLARMDFDLKPV